ncbi:MAG TPA: FmdB family zinc ribbon protein [Candidatus Dormibacteraeota bacterium]|nr:FmdB family zinc ribbon protein [Candidatus Dormibacteraeota bacterium]
MPIYGYRCSNCGNQFEVYQKMSDEPVQTCPKCEGKVTKILYPNGVVFKGSGYYSTDYKGSSASSSSNGSSASGESKPEAKPESKSDSSD